MSKDGKPDRCIAYVSEKVGGKFSALPCVAGVSCLKNRTSVEFSPAALYSFVQFLSSEGEGRIFLQGESAYDEEYRPLKKSALIGEYSAPKEILLSGARLVYCFGEQTEETKDFLKKYYAEKTFFC